MPGAHEPAPGRGRRSRRAGRAPDEAGRPPGGARPQTGRFLWLTALGTLVPGVGLIAAGRRSGRVVLALGVAGILAAVLFWWRGSLSVLTNAMVDRSMLTLTAVLLVVMAAGWLAVALASQRALEPPGLSDGRRLAGSLVVIAVASVVVTPLVYGAQSAWAAREAIGDISGPSATAPEVDTANPWASLPRVNVLLLGGDGGEGRNGVRPDTLMLASVDTATGGTVLFSLPRQLPNPPFPEGTVLAQRYPGGFTDGAWGGQLNAVYNNTPADILDDAFDGSADPRADATKQAVEGVLGIPVHYHALADLAGFEQIVDALGGVTLDVPYPIPIATKVEDGHCIWTNPDDQEWIVPGTGQELDGARTLWFARARCAPYEAAWPDQTGLQSPITIGSNHNRMERQRCIMGAIAAQADPQTLLTQFQRLTAAAGNTLTTDVPPDLWPSFAQLGLKIKDAGITTVTFNDEVLDGGAAGTPDAPDYAEIHTIAQTAIASPANLPQAEELSLEPPPAVDPTEGAESGETGEEALADETGEEPAAEPTEQTEADRLPEDGTC